MDKENRRTIMHMQKTQPFVNQVNRESTMNLMPSDWFIFYCLSKVLITINSFRRSTVRVRQSFRQYETQPGWTLNLLIFISIHFLFPS